MWMEIETDRVGILHVNFILADLIDALWYWQVKGIALDIFKFNYCALRDLHYRNTAHIHACYLF